MSKDEIPADAITSDLRTQDNTLSFWRCSSGSEIDIQSSALALIAAYERLERIDLVWIPQAALDSESLESNDTLGNTPVTDLKAAHLDIVSLDLVRLGRLSNLIQKSIKENNTKRLTKSKVKAILKLAIDDGRVSLKELNDKVASEFVDDK